MAYHDVEEELLEIGILLLISWQRNRKARKVPTPRRRNVCVRKDHLMKELSWIYLWSRKTVYCTQRYIFVQPLLVFSVQIQSPFFAFLERDWTLLPRVSTDGNTADILMLMLMLMHDRFTHTTKQHKHKLISIRKWKIFHFLMLMLMFISHRFTLTILMLMFMLMLMSQCEPAFTRIDPSN